VPDFARALLASPPALPLNGSKYQSPGTSLTFLFSNGNFRNGYFCRGEDDLTHLFRTFAITILACVLGAPLATGEIIFLYNRQNSVNQLVRIDSATPGTILGTVGLTGFPGSDNFLFGIDFRPADGLLYGRSSDGGLNGTTLQINTTTGAMTAIGTPNANGGGNSYGFDFNPVVDRIRFVSSSEINRRFNPNDGTLVNVDGSLAYALADPNFGVNPGVTHVAYSNNVPGASSTVLYGIDFSTDALVTINPPNNGILNTVGSLGVNAPNFGGFDISGATGTAYAVFRVNNISGLYTINLATGGATFGGAIGDGSLVFDGLSVQPAAQAEVPEPSSFALLGLGTLMLVTMRNRRS
jgi:hypothetical protein